MSKARRYIKAFAEWRAAEKAYAKSEPGAEKRLEDANEELKAICAEAGYVPEKAGRS